MNVRQALEEARRALGGSLAWLRQRRIEGVCDWVAEGGLRLQEFTALFGVIGDEAELRDLLEAQDEAEPSPYAGVPGVHSLRWFLFAPEGKNPPSGSPAPPGAPAGFAT